MIRVLLALLLWAGFATAQTPFRVGIIGFQMSSPTHPRVANAAAEASRQRGWEVTLLNSRGSAPEHAAQIENLAAANVQGIILAMGRTNEAAAQIEAAARRNIPIVTVMSGSSPHTVVDIAVDDFAAGAMAANYLLGLMNDRGNLLAVRYEQNISTRQRGKVLDAILTEHTAVRLLAAHTMTRPAAWQEDVRSGMETLLARHGANTQGIFAAFDGMGFLVDDLLRPTGFSRARLPIVSVDGGQETFRRIRDPNSLFAATVAIPFERMGVMAVDVMQRVAVAREPRERITRTPILFVPAVLVDATNVPADGAWPW